MIDMETEPIQLGATPEVKFGTPLASFTGPAGVIIAARRTLPGLSDMLSMNELNNRYIATLSQVRIGRGGESAVIEDLETGIPGTHLLIGPEINGMTDQEIVVQYNGILRAI